MTNAGVNGFPSTSAVVAQLDARYTRQKAAYKSGWYAAAVGALTTAVPTEARVNYSAIFIPRPCIISGLVAEVTSGGTSGALVRIGLYDTNDNGLPGNLVVDSGTADGTTNAVKENVVSVPISTPGLYWGAVVVQGSAGTRPTMRSLSGSAVSVQIATSGNDAITFAYVGYVENSVTGTLPPTATPAGATGTVTRAAIHFV